jgi:hypothetical protein
MGDLLVNSSLLWGWDREGGEEFGNWEVGREGKKLGIMRGVKVEGNGQLIRKVAKVGVGGKSVSDIQRAGIHLFLPENIEWFIEDQAFSPSHDLAPSRSPFSHISTGKIYRRHTGRLSKRGNLLTVEREGEGRSHIIRSLFLYKSLKTLWYHEGELQISPK